MCYNKEFIVFFNYPHRLPKFVEGYFRGSSEAIFSWSFKQHLLGGDWLDGEWHFLAQSLEDGDHHLVASLELLLDLFEELWVVVAVEIVSHITRVVHEGKVTLLGDIDQVVLDSGHVWYFHVMSGWRHILVLLAIENIDSGHVNLGVTVLASLRGRHIHDLARVALEHRVAVLSQSTALDWVGEGTSGTGSFEGFVVRHLAKYF